MNMKLAGRQNRNTYKIDGENILPKRPLLRSTRKVNNIKTTYFLQYSHRMHTQCTQQ